jgi:hypothetical protein
VVLKQDLGLGQEQVLVLVRERGPVRPVSMLSSSTCWDPEQYW